MVLGTAPQQRDKLKPALSYKIAVGKGGRKGKLRPGGRIVPVSVREVVCPLEGIETEIEVEVDCIDFEVDPVTKMFPRAWIPWWDYESVMLGGRKLKWRAQPWK